ARFSEQRDARPVDRELFVIAAVLDEHDCARRTIRGKRRERRADAPERGCSAEQRSLRTVEPGIDHRGVVAATRWYRGRRRRKRNEFALALEAGRVARRSADMHVF